LSSSKNIEPVVVRVAPKKWISMELGWRGSPKVQGAKFFVASVAALR